MQVKAKEVNVIKELELTIKLSGESEIKNVIDCLDHIQYMITHNQDAADFVKLILNEYNKIKK